MSWMKGPLPPNTWYWGAVVTNDGTTESGFDFANFKGDHAILCQAGPRERRVEPDQVAWWNNSLGPSPNMAGDTVAETDQSPEPAVGATSQAADESTVVAVYSRSGCPACSWMERTLADANVRETLAERNVRVEKFAPRGVRLVPTSRVFQGGQQRGSDLVGYHRPAEFLDWVEECLRTT